jgi:hypothetical protein
VEGINENAQQLDVDDDANADDWPWPHTPLFSI